MVANKLYLDFLENKAKEMQQAVINTESCYDVSEESTVYYISSEGDYLNDGLSENNPIPFAKLSELELKSGDVVLFRRNDMFRGNIVAKEGVTYSAYGVGEKPIINGSKKNYADSSLWSETELPNVYVLNEELCNVGIVVLNYTYELGNYNEMIGIRRVAGVDGFVDPESMKEDTEVFSDLKTNKLYFYSTQGNPGSRYASIDIGARGHCIKIYQWTNNVTIDNLHLTLSGGHGVASESTKNLVVRNCIVNWLGGSILTGFNNADITGYGNAVEVYGNVDGYHVYNNWLYQIYDTGVTHQFSGSWCDLITMKNVEYNDNLIEYSFWAIEYYNPADEGTTHTTDDVHIHDNFCRFGGYGWGCKGREKYSPMITIQDTGRVSNFVVENNIFDRALGRMVWISDKKNKDFFTYQNNIYIQHYGYQLGYVYGDFYDYDDNAPKILTDLLGEKNGTYIYIKDE